MKESLINVLIRSADAAWVVDPGETVQVALPIGANDDVLSATMTWDTACALAKILNDIIQSHIQQPKRDKTAFEPGFPGQIPSECGHYHPDVLRIRDFRVGGVACRLCHCKYCGFLLYPIPWATKIPADGDAAFTVEQCAMPAIDARRIAIRKSWRKKKGKP